MKRLALVLIILQTVAATASAQLCDYGFERNFTVPVFDSSLQPLIRAWEGGLNSCHFNEIDLDFDNDKDLVVFDKAGDQILCYLNKGDSGVTDYTFAPDYKDYFPHVDGWIQLKDYNCDGKEDLFAYSPAGIQVWKNISDTVLKFELITPLLNSYQYTSFSNILLTYVDYPAIEDIDGDGDLDILVFWGLGAYVQLHRNYSMENYGNCDTLLYYLTSTCWGDFAESASSNHLILDISCPWKCGEYEGLVPIDGSSGKGAKHTGSTMLALDYNQDGVKELVLGDVDFLNLALLMNGGTVDTAHMVSVDSLFPSGSVSVNLVTFPVASYIDVNNDGVKDLLVSPFDPNTTIPESFQSVWLYHNNGMNDLPNFNFEQPDFLQSEMIEVGTGAYPVLFDQDGDGLMDLLVANYGYLDSSYYEFGFLKSFFRSKLALFRNTGNADTAAFTLITRDFSGLSVEGFQSLIPAFGDLDGDGDEDMVCGESKGTLLFLENVAGSGNPAVFGSPQTNWQGIDIGEYSAPAIVDLDGDSLLDLVIGKRNGMLSWYRNTGTLTLPSFTLINDSLGKVNVTDYTYSYSGFSTPYFFKDSLGSLRLIVGSEQGKLFYYKDIESNLYGTFTSTDSVLLMTYRDSLSKPIRDGVRSGATLANLNGDLYPDLIVGNLRGGLNCFMGITPGLFSSLPEQPASGKELEILVYPNPANDHLVFSFPGLKENDAISISLFDIRGRKVAYEPILRGNKQIMDVSHLTSGIYLYQVLGEGFAGTGKFIVGK